MAEGQLKDRIEWSPDLIKKFNLVRKQMNKLVNLSPFNPDYQTYLVVDTSFIATSGVLFQMHENKKIYFWGFL